MGQSPRVGYQVRGCQFAMIYATRIGLIRIPQGLGLIVRVCFLRTKILLLIYWGEYNQNRGNVGCCICRLAVRASSTVYLNYDSPNIYIVNSSSDLASQTHYSLQQSLHLHSQI